MNTNKMIVRLAFPLAILAIFSTSHSWAEGIEPSVSEGKEITIEYTLRVEVTGGLKVIDSNVGDAPMTFIQGSAMILPALERTLEGLKVGQSTKVTLKPEEGFGHVNPAAIVEVKKNRLPKAALKVGTKLQAKQPDGKSTETRVVEIKKETVVLDSNHPLAGRKLYYEVKILGIKGPTDSS